MRRLIALLLCLVLSAAAVSAQTETPEPTATYTPAPHVYVTIPPLELTPMGQVARFDYVVSAGDVYTTDLLTAILFSLWGMFIFTVLVKWIGGRKK